MAKTAVFKNKSEQIFYVEIGKKNNLTDLSPQVFDNDFDGHAKLVLFDVYGTFYPNHETKPVFYFRHTDIAKNKYRFANIMELGDGPLSIQKGSLYPKQLADQTTPMNEYRKISNQPLIYGFDSTEPLVQYRLDEDCLQVKEGNFFTLKAEPWPITIYDHQSTYINSSVIFQPSTWSGQMGGKPFVGLGSYDRFCMKKDAGSFSDVPLAYTSLCMMGIREDGRKEMVFLSGSYNADGKTIAVYYIDGETPISADHFEFEADWYRLPYVTDETCIFKTAIVRFGGKEFHFDGKWGTKGFTDQPHIEKHGQSQIVGTWYEGKTAYTHRLSNCWSENMGAFADNLRAWGFDVIDE